MQCLSVGIRCDKLNESSIHFNKRCNIAMKLIENINCYVHSFLRKHKVCLPYPFLLTAYFRFLIKQDINPGLREITIPITHNIAA